MTPVVYLDGEISLVHRHICSRTPTRTHDRRDARVPRATAGGEETPCGAGRAGICVPIRAETFGGKIACAIAIDCHMVKKRKEIPVHTWSSGLRLAG